MKKVFLRLFIVVTLVTMTACGNNAATSQINSSSDSQNISNDIKSLKMDAMPEDATDLKVKLGRIFYFRKDKDDLLVGFLNPMTNEKKEIKVTHSENDIINSFDVTKDENIYVLTVPLRGSKNARVYQFNLNGEQKNTFTVEGHPMDMAVDENGTIFLAYENALKNKQNEIHALFSDGKVIAKNKINDYPQFFKANDGSVHFESILDENTEIKKISSDGSISVSPFQNVVDQIGYTNVFDGANNYGFYIFGEEGVLAYDNAANSTVPLVNYDKISDTLDKLDTLLPLNEKSLCIVSYNDDFSEKYFKVYNIK